MMLVNPAAGRGRAHRHVRDAAMHLRAHGATVEVAESSSAEDLTRLAAGSSRSEYDRVVVCGGDGTVNLAVREYNLAGPPLAMIPLGSGDDFARVCGIPRTIRAACEVALNGRIREVDVARANDRRYVGVAGLGFDSEVNQYANEKVRYLRGSLVYLYAIFRVLPKFEPHLVRFSNGDPNAARREEIMFAAVGNSRQYGGGIRITPNAKIDDGALDLCLVHKTTRLELLKTLPRAYNGSHIKRPFVESARGAEFSFECDHPLNVYADGEFVTRTPVTFSLEPQKLRVIVP